MKAHEIQYEFIRALSDWDITEIFVKMPIKDEESGYVEFTLWGYSLDPTISYVGDQIWIGSEGFYRDELSQIAIWKWIASAMSMKIK